MFGFERVARVRIPIPKPVSTVVRTVWKRLTVKLILAGIVLILGGYLAGASIWGGLLPLWGFGLVFLGTTFHLMIWRIRRPSRSGREFR